MTLSRPQLFAAYERWVTITALVFMLITPRISAVVTEFIPGLDAVVICTGSELITVSLDENGTPTKHSTQNTGDCTRTTDTPAQIAQSAIFTLLANTYQIAFVVHANAIATQEALASQKPKRAPPVAS